MLFFLSSQALHPEVRVRAAADTPARGAGAARAPLPRLAEQRARELEREEALADPAAAR